MNYELLINSCFMLSVCLVYLHGNMLHSIIDWNQLQTALDLATKPS